MPRWKLTAKHYIFADLYGETTQWVREETNRETGRTMRKPYNVPVLLDPEDPTCCNHATGDCVVAHKGSEQRGDIVFYGPPTADMYPLDPEAQAISDAERPKWTNPIENFDSNNGDYGAAVVALLEKQLDALGGRVPVSLKDVPNDRLDKLEALVQQLMEQNAVLQAQLNLPLEDDFKPNDLSAGGVRRRV